MPLLTHCNSRTLANGDLKRRVENWHDGKANLSATIYMRPRYILLCNCKSVAIPSSHELLIQQFLNTESAVHSTLSGLPASLNFPPVP